MATPLVVATGHYQSHRDKITVYEQKLRDCQLWAVWINASRPIVEYQQTDFMQNGAIEQRNAGQISAKGCRFKNSYKLHASYVASHKSMATLHGV